MGWTLKNPTCPALAPLRLEAYYNFPSLLKMSLLYMADIIRPEAVERERNLYCRANYLKKRSSKSFASIQFGISFEFIWYAKLPDTFGFSGLIFSSLGQYVHSFFLKLSGKVYYSEQSWWFAGGGECHAVAATEHPRWWVCLCTPSALLLAAPDWWFFFWPCLLSLSPCYCYFSCSCPSCPSRSYCPWLLFLLGFSSALATEAVLLNSLPGLSLVLAAFVDALRAVLSLMRQDRFTNPIFWCRGIF